MKAPITDRQAQAATKSIAVGGAPGLMLRVLKTGKVFYLRQSVDGKEVWRALGKYPQMSLAEARRMAISYEVKPAKAKIQGTTLDGIMLSYIRFARKTGQWADPEEQEHQHWARMTKLSPEFRARQAATITPAEMAEVLTPVILGFVDAGIKLKGQLYRAYRVAIDQGVISCINPAGEAIDSLIPRRNARPVKGNFPFLAPERVPDLMSRLYAAALAGDTGCKIAMTEILTCSRQANITGATVDTFDLDSMTMRIAREDMKVKHARFDRVAPISKQAAEIVRMGDSEGLLFKSDAGTRCGHDKSGKAIVVADADDIAEGGAGYRDPISGRVATPHGVSRASFDTWARQPKKYGHECWPDWVIDACEDHFTAKYGGAYMRELPVEEMRPVMDAWGAYCFSKIDC